MRVKLEEFADHFALLVFADDAIESMAAFAIAKTLPEPDGTLFTTRGFMDVADLERRIIFEDNPKEFVLAVEWFDHQVKLVRRDCQVILREGSLIADAMTASLN